MVRKPFLIIRHAAVMVQRTLHSYIMLSVTIVLSFSMLLAYLVYTDSSLYNTYKKLFSLDRNVVSLNDNYLENDRMELLLGQTAQIDNTFHYINYHTSAQILSDTYTLESGQHVSMPYASIYCIPETIWRFYEFADFDCEIHYLDNASHENVVLNSGEAIMDVYTFELLGLNRMEEPSCQLQLHGYDTDTISLSVRVVGTFRYGDRFEAKEDTYGNIVLDYIPAIILPLTDMSPSIAPSFQWGRSIIFRSDSPELVAQAINKMNFTASAVTVYDAQNRALEKIRTEKRTKAVIAAALLLLLGINLYSSFTNALNDRKFEIGVKRAVGASSWDIVRQFLYESIFVMLVNILLSIVIVTDIFLVYKLICESRPDQWGVFHDWIIYISPYSVAMFAICSVTLTVVFSLIFAYKSTQVEIVQYLKAE